ncbi:MAG: epoxyqueuosine reductase QueH [Lachnospiraceae bacterium]|nr:epoxyqueuosine reductase QueH [Lachnospiraceae bacterium]
MKNYQKELEAVLDKLPDHNRTLFLHSCCAPCSSYVLEYLSQYFQITVYYYNPNISAKEEYDKRVIEQKRLIRKMNEKIREQESGKGKSQKLKLESKSETKSENLGNSSIHHNPIRFLEGTYEPDRFYEVIKGLEHCREGGERCEKCFRLRLEQTAREARERGFDYFTTTLTISPLKNAELLNQIGIQICEQWKLQYLPSDFKKKNGYKRSIELSGEYDLYRQDYCGCIYSKLQRESEKQTKQIPK